MMRRFLQVTLFIISTLVPIVSAHAAPKTPIEKRNPLSEFQTKFPSASILLDNSTATPTVITNIQSERRSRTAVQIAYDFLQAQMELLIPGGSPSELESIKVQRSRNAEHVHFQQVYRGISVYRGIVSVHIQDGRVMMYIGTYHPTALFRDLPLHASISESQAESAAMQELSRTGIVSVRGGEIQTERYIYRSDAGRYHLAYQVKVPAATPFGDWELMIDAHTGAILHQRNHLMHADDAGGNNTVGNASIYEENPLTTRILVDTVLPNLDGSGFLKGSFVDVLIYDGPAGVRVDSRQFDNGLRNNAKSLDNDFRYAVNDGRFDEANVYFHINRIHDYFKGTFEFTERDLPFPVIVGYPAFNEKNGRVLNEPMDNAFFSPFKQRLGIGRGTGRAKGGLNNLARDADVLYHEYTHAVIDRITELGVNEHDFGRAMGEAYADYFASSYFSDPDMGEWAVNRQSGMRNLKNNNRFPDDIHHPGTGAPEEHYTGLIWGGGLWSLRGAVGQNAADQIIFNSLYFLPKNGTANFQIGVTALLAADASISDGIHQAAIRQVFEERGICESTGCPLVSGEKIRRSISNVELLGTNQYTIEVPNAQTTLNVELQAAIKSRDIDLYVRFDKPVELVQRRRAAPQITADYESESENGIESITITPESELKLQSGTYYVAIVNWEETPKLIDYDLTVTIGKRSPIENLPPKIEIDVTPTVATIEAGGQQQLIATVTGSDNARVIWEVNGIVGGNSQVGTIRSDGVYIAPQNVPEDNPITITVISEADRDIRAEILVTITPRAELTLSTESTIIPAKSVLLPNYPNPFNPETWIPYQLSKPAHVVISIYDVTGQLIRQLDLGQKAAGTYISQGAAAYWDGQDRFGEVVANGIYFYHIQASDFNATRRMAVVK